MTTTIRLRYDNDLEVRAGRNQPGSSYMVIVTGLRETEISMTPIEAERLASALFRYAERARVRESKTR